METLFDDIPDPEPEYPPDTGPWMSLAKLHAGLDDIAESAKVTAETIAKAFDVPLDVLTEPEAAPKPPLITMPLEKSPGPKWLPGGMGPAKPVTEKVPNVPAPTETPYVPLETEPSGQVPAKAMNWNEPIAPVTSGHSWLKDLLMKPVPTPVLVKLQLHEVEHHAPYHFGITPSTHYNPPWTDSELSFATTSGPMEVSVKMTGHQWKQLGSPQTLTVQILGE